MFNDLLKTCDDGYLLGCNNLGLLYYNGNGVTTDYNKAVKLFKRTCDGNEAIGCDNYRLVKDDKERPTDPKLYISDFSIISVSSYC